MAALNVSKNKKVTLPWILYVYKDEWLMIEGCIFLDELRCYKKLNSVLWPRGKLNEIPISN